MLTETEQVVRKRIYCVYIKASQKKIWDTITKADRTQQYGYGWRIEYDLRPGGGFWVFTSEVIKQNGAIRGIKVPDLLFKGDVVEVNAPHRLELCWNTEAYAQTTGNCLTNLTYEIENVPDDFSKLAFSYVRKSAINYPFLLPEDVEPEFENINWRLILCDLKSLLETGKGFMF